MQNGRITVVRIIASALIGIVTVGAGAYLIAQGFEVPTQFWLIGGVAVVGVVGADIGASILKSIKK